MSSLRQLFSGLRFRLLLLVLLTCAPLVALTLHRAGADRRRQMADWSQLCEKLSLLAQREQEEIIGSARQLLLAVAESSAASVRAAAGIRES